MTTQFASLWIGDALSPLEQLCAASFVATGNALTIYTYGKVDCVPSGISVADANTIMPGENIVRYRKSNYPSLHANLFRYALLSKTNFVWTDLDLLALKPMSFDQDYVFGWQEEELVNNAVLRLPKSSRTLQSLRRYHADYRGFPPTASRARKLEMALLSFGRGYQISDWAWGTLGPNGLTHFLKKHDELGTPLAQNAFYWLRYHDCERVLKPGNLSFEDLPEDALGLHLWSKSLRPLCEKLGWFPENSFLQKAAVRYGVI